MFPKLRKNTQYTRSGEFFSKLLFIRSFITTEESSLVLVTPNSHSYGKYKKIAADTSLGYDTIDSYNDLHSIGLGTPRVWNIQIDMFHAYVEEEILNQSLGLSVGKNISMGQCISKLADLGFDFSEFNTPGSYKKSGDIIEITLLGGQQYKISFWGDEIEEIFPKNQTLLIGSLEKIKLTPQGKGNKLIGDIISEKNILILFDSLDFHHSYETYLGEPYNISSFDTLKHSEHTRASIDLGVKNLEIGNIEDLKNLLEDSRLSSMIYTKHSEMIREFLSKNNLSHIGVISIKNHVSTSFILNNNAIICDDILQKIFIKKRIRKKLSADIDLLLKIKSGDYVVHIDHGIGVFQGIIKKSLGKIEKEYLHISYKENDNLYVPITEVSRVSKYVGNENPKLTPLSGKIWEKKMKKIHEDIREIAQEILKNFAERKLRVGSPYNIIRQNIEEFQSSFPYAYTFDQEQAVADIFTDLASDKNMDRLLVGDVGFGKTEIAFNAAFVSLLNKKQVVLISPLVVLAHEHYEKAAERFGKLGYKVEVLTRMQSVKHANRVIKELRAGTIDMIVGTHRLLGESIRYKNLGVMIIDEEHKFGVSDKEKIKKVRSNVDILSLSATPIPRSLNLALSGVRDISLIKTPPKGRKSIETSVLRYNESLIQEVGEREFQRGGQIFFVHNRVSNIEVFKKRLEALFPKKKIIITHGQLPGDELENRILDFKNKKYDILLSTTVIENGIDFSNVNTIFINECQQFGISQIHQLRGRVGRSQVQGYCYLLYKKDNIDGDAAKRIQTIVDYSYLGAGFELAMKDLEIRGGGDILGIRQSGQAQEIGVSLFLKMLEEKIEELKESRDDTNKEEKKSTIKTKIELQIEFFIPNEYFLSETDKLNFYREIELIEDMQDLEYLHKNLFKKEANDTQHNGIKNLFLLLEVQLLSSSFGITNIRKVGVNYQIEFSENGDISSLKNFLKRDREVRFKVIDAIRVRTPAKGFENEQLFLQYLLHLLGEGMKNTKIKLVKKA